jgi:DNA primase
LPHTGETPEECYLCAAPLSGTAGESYVEKRGIPAEIAHDTGVRFMESYLNDRPAVIVPLRNREGTIVSLHGRFLHSAYNQNKMFTFGSGDGVISVGEDWKSEPLIIVEGLFDALSLAVCGWSSIATIGRIASWLPEVTANRTVWLAFDNGKPAEASVVYYTKWLQQSDVRRMSPPARCKDWNTALAKCGKSTLDEWIRHCIGERSAILV